jgi:hypothetical protein
MDRFIRTGTWAAALGGLLLAAGAGVTLVFGQGWLRDSTTVSSGLRLAGAVLMTWGLIALYGRQADAAGRLGVVAVIACLVNMMLQAGWMFADLFIAPSIESLSPGLLDGPTPPRLGLGFMLAWLANASFLLLAVATLRARALPRTCAIALAAAGVITLIPLPFDGPAYEVIIGLAFTTAALTVIPTNARRRPQLAPVHP